MDIFIRKLYSFYTCHLVHQIGCFRSQLIDPTIEANVAVTQLRVNKLTPR